MGFPRFHIIVQTMLLFHLGYLKACRPNTAHSPQLECKHPCSSHRRPSRQPASQQRSANSTSKRKRLKISKKKRTYNTLPQLPLTNPPPFPLPTNSQQKPILQPQIPLLLLLLRREHQLLARHHARAVILELADSMRTRGFGFKRAGRC